MAGLTRVELLQSSGSQINGVSSDAKQTPLHCFITQRSFDGQLVWTRVIDSSPDENTSVMLWVPSLLDLLLVGYQSQQSVAQPFYSIARYTRGGTAVDQVLRLVSNPVLNDMSVVDNKFLWVVGYTSAGSYIAQIDLATMTLSKERIYADASQFTSLIIYQTQFMVTQATPTGDDVLNLIMISSTDFSIRLSRQVDSGILKNTPKVAVMDEKSAEVLVVGQSNSSRVFVSAFQTDSFVMTKFLATTEITLIGSMRDYGYDSVRRQHYAICSSSESNKISIYRMDHVKYEVYPIQPNSDLSTYSIVPYTTYIDLVRGVLCFMVQSTDSTKPYYEFIQIALDGFQNPRIPSIIPTGSLDRSAILTLLIVGILFISLIGVFICSAIRNSHSAYERVANTSARNLLASSKNLDRSREELARDEEQPSRSDSMRQQSAHVLNPLPLDDPESMSPTALDPETTVFMTDVSQTSMAITLKDNKVVSIPSELLVKHGEDFHIHAKLAKGGGGSVYVGRVKTTKLQQLAGMPFCVVKVLDRLPGVDESDSIAHFLQEVALMWYFNDKANFAKMIGFSIAPAMIIMKLYPLKSLNHLIYHGPSKDFKKSVVYCPALVMRLACNIASALYWMHDKDIVHSDIKPANVLLDENEDGVYALLTDFGYSSIVSDKTPIADGFQKSSISGISVPWAAPEVLLVLTEKGSFSKDPEVRKASDMYSLGMLLYEMICQKPPWSGYPNDKIIPLVMSGERPSISSKILERVNDDGVLSLIVSTLMTSWSADYRNRPSSRDVRDDFMNLIALL